ncbi:hypothetical protein Y032_0005g2642 [Ancylostoma ceylanicum]|nr:hypothetical protein Y032_0005g2642 [Ancylostoma ceylanicum]
MQNFPAQYREMLPEPVKKFMSEYTEQDQAAMRQFYQNYHTYKSDDEAKAALRALSPNLAARVEQYQSYVKGQAAALGPEARAFYDEMDRRNSQTRAQIYAGIRPTPAQMKKAGLEAFNMWRAMSPAGRADFQKHFPVFAMYLSNDMIYNQLQSMN